MTGKLFFKGRCHIFTYFITVLTDGRSDGGKNFSGVTMKFPAHHLDGMLPHASDRSSPPGMGKSDRMVYGIYKIKRYTVSVKSCQNQSRFIRHQPVHIRIRPFLCHTIAPAASIHPPDIRRMGLIRTDNIRKRSSHCLCHSAVVFRHCLRIISTCKTQIQTLKHSGAASTLSGGKTVLYARMCQKKGKIQKRKPLSLFALKLFQFQYMLFIFPLKIFSVHVCHL